MIEDGIEMVADWLQTCKEITEYKGRFDTQRFVDLIEHQSYAFAMLEMEFAEYGEGAKQMMRDHLAEIGVHVEGQVHSLVSLLL